MTYRNLFFLALTAICLALLLRLIDQREREIHETAPDAVRLFPGFDPARMTRLTLDGAEWTAVIERHDREWRIIRPFAERADAERIHDLLAYLDRLPIIEWVTPDQWMARGLSLRQFGLDPPRMILTLADGDREYVLRIGMTSPLDQGLYVKADGVEWIALTDGLLIDLLPRELNDLRERTFFQGLADDVVRLDIKPYAGAYLRLERAPDGRWTIRQPVTARTERGVVRQRLETLFDARIRAFLPDLSGTVLATHGVEEGESVLQVTVWKRGMEHGTDLYFGHPAADDADAVYARRGDGGGGLFTVARDLRDRLMLSPDDVRDKNVVPVEPWTVTQMALQDRDRTLVLGLREDGWYVTEPVQWKAEDAAIIDMLVAISDLRARQFVSGVSTNQAVFGLDQPACDLTLWTAAPHPGTDPVTASNVPAARIRVGNPVPDNGAYYARRNDDPAIFTLAAADIAGRLLGTNSAGMALTDPLVYRDRSILSVPPETVWRIELQRGAARYAVERDGDGEWHAILPAGHRVDSDQLNTVLDMVRDLRALRIEQRGIGQPAAFGFDRPGWSMTLSLTGADGLSKTIVTGFRARTDGIFAMLQGRDLVFAIDRDVSERLSRDLTMPASRVPGP